MKRFLPATVAFCLTFFSTNAFSQTIIDTFATPGTFVWVCPYGVAKVSLQMWGGGEGSSYWSGGGGAFVQTTQIPVTAGQSYIIRVAHGAVSGFATARQDTLNTTFGQQGNVLVTANGAGYTLWTSPIIVPATANGNELGGAVSTGQYVASSYAGGNGVYCNPGANLDGIECGGAAAGSSCGTGANGTQYSATGAAGQCGAGSGGNLFSAGGFPGGGGGITNSGQTTPGSNGQVILTYTYTTTPGTVDSFKTPGLYKWVCPIGVSSVLVQLWGGGGAGTSYGSGGGGAFTQSTPIPVTAGQTYWVQVGEPEGTSYASAPDSSWSSFGPQGSPYVAAQGASFVLGFFYFPGLASGGAYVAASFNGGTGASTIGNPIPSGGAAAASICGPGANGNWAGYPGYGHSGAGSGGNGLSAGGFPGGGGGSVYAGYANTTAGGGEVILSYTCNAGTPGTIGTAHTITYPPELIPDSITNITKPTLPTGASLTWQQSTDGQHWVTTKTKDTLLAYRFDKDSLQTATWYRRGSNACLAPGSYGNWSNTVQIKTGTYENNIRNGQITGYVYTRNGSGISGRKVYVKSLTPLKGRSFAYTDSALTNNAGQFIVDSVYYGDHTNGDSSTVRFKVYPDTTGGHRYDTAWWPITINYVNNSVTLPTPNVNQSTPFVDTTVLALTGQVYQVCTGCLNSANVAATITGALDSVHIKGIGMRNTATNNETDSAVTGYANPPGLFGIYSMSFQEPDIYTVTPVFKNHKFVPGDSVVSLYASAGTVNFNDTTTHVISGFFGAGCNSVIGNAVLEFDDSLPKFNGAARASVFRKRVTTGTNGYYSIRLPARAYKVTVISDSINDSHDKLTQGSVVQSFINSLPVASRYRDITKADTTLNLVYQREPNMQVTGLVDSSAIKNCSSSQLSPGWAIWPQGLKKAVTFSVFQGPASLGCPLSGGKVDLETDVNSYMGVYTYDTTSVVNGKAVDSIVGAQPNAALSSTGTYSKHFKATYTDGLGRTSVISDLNPAGQTPVPYIIVTGAAIDPSGKNFVTVTPQLPFLVVHDPPGSESFSAWSQGVTTQQTISLQAQGQNTVGANLQVAVGLDEEVGLFVETPIKVFANIDDNFSTTRSYSNTNQTVITSTAQQTFQTSPNPNFTGSDADVFYGAAYNIKYAVGQQLGWNSSTCATIGPKPVMVTDIEKDTTSFVYTLSHIRDELIPTLQWAARAKPDSAAYFNNQAKVWQQLVSNNLANIKQAPVLSNTSFSSGTSITNSTTLENTTSNTYDFSMVIDNTVATQLGFEIAGNGLSGGVSVNFQMTTGGSTTTTTSTATTTSYTLADNNNSSGTGSSGDAFSVNIKKDPVYGTPMFETVAGNSECPYETGTVALDNPLITANNPVQTGISSNATNFVLNLYNQSSGIAGTRPYVLFLDQTTNPYGATVLINGSPIPSDGVTFNIPNNGTPTEVTVTVGRNANGPVYNYNYDNLQFILSDNCQYQSNLVQTFLSNPHQFSSVNISADFVAPVSGVNIVTPANNWLANSASGNTVPFTFNGYDTSRFATLQLQYSAAPTGYSTGNNWVTIASIPKTSLGTTTTSTTYNWNIASIPDSSYSLRVMVQDKNNNTAYSQVATGLVARRPPALYGVPQPANGIYTAGTQIAFSYTENLNSANLRSSMVHMQDLTAGSAITTQISAFANTLVIVPGVNLSQLTGHGVRVIVDSVADLYGNVKTTPDTSYFTIGASSFSTGTDAVNVTIDRTSIYEDATGYMGVHFKRNSADSVPILIYYTLAGNAVYGKDYTLTYSGTQAPAAGVNGAQGAILLPADSASITMFIHPVKDTLLMPNKISTLTLAPGGGYSIGSNYTVTDTILNHSLAAPVITPNIATTQCAGDSVTLSTASTISGTPVTLLWSTGATTTSIKVKTSGNYTVKASSAQGFTSYSAPTVVTFTCGSPAGLAAKVVNKDTVVLNWGAVGCAAKYLLQFRPAGTTTWVTDTVAKNLDTLKGLKFNTSYQWQVASVCGKPPYTVSAYTAGSNFTTPPSTAAGFGGFITNGKQVPYEELLAFVYPNPASTSANLQVKGAKGEYNVLLVNMQGVVLWQAQKVTDSYIQLPLSHFAPGIYMIVVTDKEHTGRIKLMKQ